MNDKDLKARVQHEVIAKRFPELSDVDPTVQTRRSESRLRKLRRVRGELSTEEIQGIPEEHELVYQVKEGGDQPFDRTIVVVTDEDGTAQIIIESK